jgi:hypothetical protein
VQRSLVGRRFGAAAVLAAALVIRAPLILPSLPYLGYVDEGHVLHPVLTLLRTGGWDPHWYLHPSLTIYLITLLVHVMRPAYFLMHGHSLLQDLPVGAGFYDVISPPEVILAGRCVVLAASLGIVALGMVLARRMAGPRAALGAGILLALCPALVQRGAIVIVDTVAAFFVLATLLAAERLRRVIADGGATAARACRGAFLAGLLAGASAAAKYPAGLVFLVVFLALLGPRHEWRSHGRLLLFAMGGLFVGAFIGTPAFVLRPRAVVAALLEQSRLYATPTLFSAGGGGSGLFRQALSPDELGIAVCAIGVAGFLALLWRRTTRTVALEWLVFATAFVLPVLVPSYQPFRYALPLVPPLLIAAAALLFSAPPGPSAPRVVLSGAGLVLILMTFIPGWKWTYRERGVRDSRAIFIDWLVKTVRPDLRVLFVRELAFLPKELDRVPATVMVVPWSETKNRIENGDFDALVYGKFDLAGALPTLEVPKADLVQFENWLQTLKIEIRLGSAPTPVYPFFWRTNQELILVAINSNSGQPLRRSPPASGSQ